jgi:hypothetical protein
VTGSVNEPRKKRVIGERGNLRATIYASLDKLYLDTQN